MCVFIENLCVTNCHSLTASKRRKWVGEGRHNVVFMFLRIHCHNFLDVRSEVTSLWCLCMSHTHHRGAHNQWYNCCSFLQNMLLPFPLAKNNKLVFSGNITQQHCTPLLPSTIYTALAMALLDSLDSPPLYHGCIIVYLSLPANLFRVSYLSFNVLHN